MILDAERRLPPVPDPFDGVVVQIDVGDFQIGGETFGVECEVMVLRGDFDRTLREVADRMVAAVVAELQPAASGAAGESEQLVSEADPHQRNFSDQAPHRFDRVGDRGRVRRTVGEEDAVRFVPEHLLRRGAGGHHGDAHVFRREFTQDVVFDSVIQRDHPEITFFVPFE